MVKRYLAQDHDYQMGDPEVIEFYHFNVLLIRALTKLFGLLYIVLVVVIAVAAYVKARRDRQAWLRQGSQ